MKRFFQTYWPHILLVIALVVIIAVSVTIRYNVNRARIAELERMGGELVKSGVTLEALLSDEPTSIYIHPEVWSGLKEHRGNLRKALALLQPEAGKEVGR